MGHGVNKIMKRFARFTVLFLLFWVTACVIEVCHVNGQSINKISSRCPSPSLLSDSVFAKADGNIYYAPCSGFSSIFTGIVDFSGASSVIFPGGGAGVSGSGTANFVPRWTSTNVLANTPFSWNGTTYAWNNTALTGTWLLGFTPSSTTTGTFSVGLASQTLLSMTGSTKLVDFNTFGSSAINARVDNTLGTFTIQPGDATTGIFEVTGVGGGQINLFGNAGITVRTLALNMTNVTNTSYMRTLTAAGTTGAQVINKPQGSVNFAAAATTLVVTNSLAVATSLIWANALTNDTTCHVKDVERASGSFTIRMTAACTAETAVAFWVTN